MSIMTACGFHDLVGQRVTKITETLDRVIARRLNGEESKGLRPAARSEIALEGPALPGTPQDQVQIDALFGDKN
ncbi:MAG TPA: hypothetical protein VMW05_07845 [Methyloceanibacter sp.]|nr:hypothetical protein [Methyloceanibacter sp.]